MYEKMYIFKTKYWIQYRKSTFSDIFTEMDLVHKVDDGQSC